MKKLTSTIAVLAMLIWISPAAHATQLDLPLHFNRRFVGRFSLRSGVGEPARAESRILGFRRRSAGFLRDNDPFSRHDHRLCPAADSGREAWASPYAGDLFRFDGRVYFAGLRLCLLSSGARAHLVHGLFVLAGCGRR